MKEPDYIVVFITASTAGEAQKLAGLLLQKKQAACVNIVPTVESSFWWQGKIDSARESLLVIKTRAAKLPEIVELVRGAHSYSVPEIIALPIVGGNPDYLEWLEKETS